MQLFVNSMQAKDNIERVTPNGIQIFNEADKGYTVLLDYYGNSIIV
ncbi:hypothetical protein [Sodalis-like endosymbiont of Proechinophthirus fluctus]|nr:hypothetical protein [Sodalis-like endosymbiont of Proechinophthirus fluctus]